MRKQLDQSADPLDGPDAILAADEADAWTLDELDHSADLGSLRSAWGGDDESIF